MPRLLDPLHALIRRVPLAGSALRAWSLRQWSVAAAFAVAIGLLLGVATVLIPNGFFSRDIPPTAWSYPVWIATSLLSGLLAATYVRPTAPAAAVEGIRQGRAGQERGSGWGLAGGLLAWFAIGCPVCNKIALLALGYSGALAYFAPLQPWLATLALLLTAVAAVQRLAGQVACPVPADRTGSTERTTA